MASCTLSWLVFSCPEICLLRSSMSVLRERTSPSRLCRSCFRLLTSARLSSTCLCRLYSCCHTDDPHERRPRTEDAAPQRRSYQHLTSQFTIYLIRRRSNNS